MIESTAVNAVLILFGAVACWVILEAVYAPHDPHED